MSKSKHPVVSLVRNRLREINERMRSFDADTADADAQQQTDDDASFVQVGADELQNSCKNDASFVQDNCKNDASSAPDSLNLHKTDTFELSAKKLAQNLQTAPATQSTRRLSARIMESSESA